MTDPNHSWNTGKQITTKKQHCGCHITSKKFKLCLRGQDFKNAVDDRYRLWQAQKDTQVDPVAITRFLGNFEKHKKAYLQHLATGMDWAL